MWTGDEMVMVMVLAYSATLGLYSIVIGLMIMVLMLRCLAHLAHGLRPHVPAFYIQVHVSND